MKKYLLLIFSAILISLFSACSDNPSNPDDKGEVDLSLAGKWYVDLMKVKEEGKPETIVYADAAGYFSEMTLDKEGNFSFDYSDVDTIFFLGGSWTANNTAVTLKDDSGAKLNMNIGWHVNREWGLPRDTLFYKKQGAYFGTPAELTFIYKRQFDFQKDAALEGKWRFEYMNIDQNGQNFTFTKDNPYINYTLDFQDSWFRLDSVISGHTEIFTDDRWQIIDNKIYVENDFGEKIWKYTISSDTLTIRFKGKHESADAIFMQKFKKID